MCLNIDYDEMAWACTWKAWTIWSIGICLKWLELALERLEPWLWSFAICLKWLEFTLGRHASCEFLVFDVAHVFMGLWCYSCLHAPLMGSGVGLRLIQESNWASFTLRLLGLSSFTTYKVQTIIMGSSVGLESSWFKQRPNTCIMQCNLHGLA